MKDDVKELFLQPFLELLHESFTAPSLSSR